MEEITQKEKWLTVLEVLGRLNESVGRDDLLTQRTVQNMFKRGDFGEVKKLGRLQLVSQTGVDNYLHKGSQAVNNG